MELSAFCLMKCFGERLQTRHQRRAVALAAAGTRHGTSPASTPARSRNAAYRRECSLPVPCAAAGNRRAAPACRRWPCYHGAARKLPACFKEASGGACRFGCKRSPPSAPCARYCAEQNAHFPHALPSRKAKALRLHQCARWIDQATAPFAPLRGTPMFGDRRELRRSPCRAKRSADC